MSNVALPKPGEWGIMIQEESCGNTRLGQSYALYRGGEKLAVITDLNAALELSRILEDGQRMPMIPFTNATHYPIKEIAMLTEVVQRRLGSKGVGRLHLTISYSPTKTMSASWEHDLLTLRMHTTGKRPFRLHNRTFNTWQDAYVAILTQGVLLARAKHEGKVFRVSQHVIETIMNMVNSWRVDNEAAEMIQNKVEELP
jgi:hypothetical protein